LVLGFNVSNDGGKLFTLAIIVFIASGSFLILHQNELKSLIHRFTKK
jgi:hypothetical protein